jgi:hypothetical protein
MMARGPYWLCTDLLLIRANLDKTDAEIAAMFPGRKPKAILAVRWKYRMMKCPQRAPIRPRYPSCPQPWRGRHAETDAVYSG